MDYPINDISFINNKTILVCGGGGESKSGVPNKITAVRCSFKIKDKTRRLQKFREVNLPKNEDSPLCLAVSKNLERSEGPEFTVLVGCNQSQELRSLNVNNNVRKYTFVENNHFTFQDAAQFDEDVLLKPRTEDPKHIQVASDSSVAVMMTTATPSEMVIFNPSMLEPMNRITPPIQSEILDLHLCPYDNGQTLTYITSTAVTTIYTNSGAPVPASTSNASKTEKIFSKYFFSKVHYMDASRILLVGSLKSRKGTAVLEYNIQTGKVIKEKTLFSTCRPVALAFCEANGLVAIALNDFSVTLVKAADFKVVKTYKKLHNFAITCLSFCPNGSKLASGSAAQTLNVIKLDSSPGFLWRLFKFFFWAIFFALIAVGLQIANQSGSLDTLFDLLRLHGGDAYVHAHKYGKLTYDLSQQYGAEYYEKAQHHGAIYFDVAQRYGKIGLELAKVKGMEGYSLVLDKVEKWRAEKAATSEFSETPEWINTISETTETPTTLSSSRVATSTSSPSSPLSSSSTSTSIDVDEYTTTFIPSSSTEPSLLISSTTNDMMTEVTKKVNTKDGESVDTISLISEAVNQITNVDSLKSMTSEATESLGSMYSSAASVASLLVSDVTSSLSEAASTEQVTSVESAALESLKSSTVLEPIQGSASLSVSSVAPENSEIVEEVTTITVSSTSTTSIDYSSETASTLSLESSAAPAVTTQIEKEEPSSEVHQTTSEPVYQQTPDVSLTSLINSISSSLTKYTSDTTPSAQTEAANPSVDVNTSKPSSVSSATLSEATSSVIASSSSEDHNSTKISSPKVSEKSPVGHSASLDFPTEKSADAQINQKKFSETPADAEPISTPRVPDDVKPVPETNPKRTPAEPVPESFPSQESSSSIQSSSRSESSVFKDTSLKASPSSSTESSSVISTSSPSTAITSVETKTVTETLSTAQSKSPVTTSSAASAPEKSSTNETAVIETPIQTLSAPETTQTPLSAQVTAVTASIEDSSDSARETTTLIRIDDKPSVAETTSSTSITTNVVHDEF